MRRLSSVKDKLFRPSTRFEKCESHDKAKSSRAFPSITSSASGSGSYSNSNNYGDAPPAYTPGYGYGSAPAPASLPPSQQFTAGVHGGVSDDDTYANLANFDTVLLIDDSGSMRGSLWSEAEEALKSIAEIVTTYDQDGMDLYFLNHKSANSPSDKSKAKHGYYNVIRKETIEEVFRDVYPAGATYTGKRLEEILRPYIRKVAAAKDEEVKPMNLIVITDGAPSDNPEQAIVQTAKALDQMFAPSYQVGIQFFQIGADVQAARALQQLDDGLSRGGIRDIVDTTPCQWEDAGRLRAKTLTGPAILKVVLGAVDKRIDNSRLGSSR